MICEVAVFGFTVGSSTYTYLIPDNLILSPGQVVTVPFGKRTRKGVVVSVDATSVSPYQLKPLSGVRKESPILNPIQLALSSWIAKNYFISQAEAIQLMLPRIPKIGLFESHRQAVQELILFPTVSQAAHTQRQLGGVLFSHSDRAAEFDETWDAIRLGRVKKIFGARSALFAPFADLARITIFQSESDLFKEERQPYYRALDVAQELARLSGAQLRPISYSPRIQDQFLIKHQIRRPPPGQRIEFLNLRHHRIVSNELLEKLKETSGRVLLFLNRKSERGPLTCRTCKSRSYTSDPSICPVCGSADVRFQLLNIGSVEQEIRRHVTGEFTFATQQIFFQDTKPFDLVVVISADTFLTRGNYTSSEKTFELVTNLRRLLKPSGIALIQTAFPEEPAIKFAALGDYPSFYRQELALRRETGYPPAKRLAKLSYYGRGDAPKLDLPTDLEVFGPFSGRRPYLILRALSFDSLTDLPRQWKLDIDPLSI